MSSSTRMIKNKKLIKSAENESCTVLSSKTNSLCSIVQPPQSKPIKVIHPKSMDIFLPTKKSDLWNKPFLGGYIDKRTKLKYHDAHVQHPVKNQKCQKLRCRQTQTVKMRNTKQQTLHCQHTQMDRNDLLLDHSKDIYQSIHSDQYIDAKKHKLLKIECCIKIQCAMRSFLAKKKLKQLKNEKNERMKTIKSKSKKEKIVKNKKNKLRKYKQKNPVHSFEFKQIMNALTHRNNKELTKLIRTKNICKASKQKQKTKMIKSHNKTLRSLQKKQIKIEQKHKQMQKENVLKQMMSPKTWIMSNGRPMSVRTPTTHRAEQLIVVYNALKDDTMSIEHRLRLLDALGRRIQSEIDINTLKIQKVVKEIFELIEREKEMIKRNRPKKSFRGVRTRLIHKYFDLLMIPQFNPESARFSSTPRHVSNKLKPKLIAKGYKKRAVRTHAFIPNTQTFVQFNVTC